MLGGLPPSTQYTASNKLLSFVLGADPRILRKKTKMARGKFTEKSQKFASTEPHGGIEISVIPGFLTKSSENIHAFFENWLFF